MIEVIHHKHNNDDMLVVDAARASFAKTGDQYTQEQNNRLINYLAREKHINPFFHNRFTFSFDKRDIDLWGLSQNQVAGMAWKVNDACVNIRHSFYGWLGLIKHIKDEDRAARVHMTLINKMPESSAAYGHLDPDGLELDDYSVYAEHPDFIDVSLFLKVPIFLARQEFTHKVGFTRSERSGRYVSDTPENFMPSAWREKPKDGVKQGSGGTSLYSATASQIAKDTYDEATGSYQWMLRRDIAPEQARMLLPQAMMTRYMVTGSLSAFRRMHTERVASNAQSEIRDYAHMVDEILSKEYGHKWGL
ncbi:flavin-dependent thymidylate synthase [Alcaligenes phage CASP1]|nr:flavin-dependent thymidylate synthase [Alcaligenes phage CASP1]